MTKLSVNINKIATLRNARGGSIPNVLTAAKNCELFGAQGITVHPRPDERHITYQDVLDLSPIVSTEFNVEGYPNKSFMKLVLKAKPKQVTLVPDPPDALTSNSGWNTIKEQLFLKDIIATLKAHNIRTSIFIDTNLDYLEGAKQIGADRIEFYTEPYAINYRYDKHLAVAPFVKAAEHANMLDLGINAGHDLNLENLKFFAQNVPNLLEVSIGHALISDALYFGLENTIAKYLKLL